jgi:hypothetical protein
MLLVIEIVAALIFMLFFGTQVIFPLIKDLPLFPIFRSESALRAKIIEQHSQKVELELQREIAENQRKLDAETAAQQQKPVDQSQGDVKS